MIVLLDTNCLVAGVLSQRGPCAEILDRWRDGQFDVAVSPHLLTELEQTLGYPRITARYNITRAATDAVIRELQQQAVMFTDPPSPPRTVPGDPNDDYIVALANASASRFVVTRDKHFDKVERTSCTAAILSPEEFLLKLRADDTHEP